MSSSKLPYRASLEYLRKLAKSRLREIRRSDPNAKLAAAQLAVARDHGFSSWRALKAEVDHRSVDDTVQFFEACANGDAGVVARMLAENREFATAADERRPHAAWTALHTAAFAGHANVVRLLLQRGADPHAREAGDNTTPLHWAAARGDLDTIRALLDAGADVHGTGDVHELDVIGWATVYRSSEDISEDVLALLQERGARHHIYSAIAIGDPEMVRAVAREDPTAIERRMSRFEHGQWPLHFAMERKRHDLVDLLIELGADVNAVDLRGQTPLAVAMVRGAGEGTRRLRDAGATSPVTMSPSRVTEGMAKLARATKKGVPMIGVPDIAAALAWYKSIGFSELGRYAENGVVNFGMLSFGAAEMMFGIDERPNAANVRLWFYTDEVDALYELLKFRQLNAAQAALDGKSGGEDGIHFDEDLYDPFYGGRQFSIRDPSGYSLIFYRDG